MPEAFGSWSTVYDRFAQWRDAGVFATVMEAVMEAVITRGRPRGQADLSLVSVGGARGGRPVSHDAELYMERNTVERCINKIKDWRGLATRFDKRPDSYMAGLQLRGVVIWLRSLRPA